MSNPQLDLFADENEKRGVAAELVSDLYHRILHYKHVMYLTDISIGKETKEFEACDTLIRLLAVLGHKTTDFFKIEQPHKGWAKVLVYDPYYAAVEPRSPEGLAEIVAQYESSSKRLIKRINDLWGFGIYRELLVENTIEDINYHLLFLKRTYGLPQF